MKWIETRLAKLSSCGGRPALRCAAPGANAPAANALSAVEALEGRRLFSTGYVLTDLGTFGGDTSTATDINDAGVVVGYAKNAKGIDHAFQWSASTGLVDLTSPLSSKTSRAFGISSSGFIVGDLAASAQSAPRAFFFEPGSGLITLALLPGTTSATAYAVNDAGFVVGQAGGMAAIWAGGNSAFLPKSGAMGTAFDINRFGLAVGTEDGKPTSMQGNIAAELGSIDPFTGRNGVATGINAKGDAVGYSDVGDGTTTVNHAFIDHLNTITDLGTLGGDARANGLNDTDTVVGIADSGGTTHAFVWAKAGGIEDLNKLIIRNGLGWTLESATAVNNKGQIVGYGVSPNGKEHAFLLTPATKSTDLQIPKVFLKSAAPLRQAQFSYVFNVKYTDNTAVDVSDLANTNIRVTGPGGFSKLAKFVFADSRKDGPSRTATYRILGDDGGFARADNGTYTVSMVSNQVSDISNVNFVRGGALGTFVVKIPAPASVEAQPAEAHAFAAQASFSTTPIAVAAAGKSDVLD